ncbi:fucose-1-phosphate guanylyltransferase [Esox lucius]|uniref:GDP-fucose pyrophosphorylase domain-containing protein n=1 Tax=Esox lucius TaxID=8010 RepID=A0A3P8YI31_ESOLU|nr:fucose-1-phosphate guanylyltransferase [Esox lucius]
MNEHGSKTLQISTREKLERFNTLRGKRVQPGEFWDLVVLTAVDEDQREAYELQISEKLKRRHIPHGIPYHVFSDPPGPKIGNGGATLYSLQKLEDIYGKALGEYRVLLIHAGGYSQRLPSASALGKVFTAMPLGDPLYQMLEVKLAVFVDIPRHMKPGVLVTSADCIELYSVSEKGIVFDRSGFTALAHPSHISIGTTHGVFVMDQREQSGKADLEYRTSLRFLHKPSIRQMYDSGAVCKTSDTSVSLLRDEEFVYTDSTYYVDYQTAIYLLALFRELGPLDCEIDAYGDFLQALGPQATVAYTSNTANVTKHEGSLVKIRQKIFHHLRGTPLSVVALNHSKFYHIGTSTEYLFYLTEDPCLRAELGLYPALGCNQNFSSKVSCELVSEVKDGCSLTPGSVVEYCRLEAGVQVGGRTILSGCWVGTGLKVPDGVFMHSLCVNRNGQTGFVTVAFGIEDDLKKSIGAPANMEGLNLYGISLVECLAKWGLSSEDLRFSGDTSNCSLWNACLFPVCSDMRSSFWLTLEMVQALQQEGSTILRPASTKRMSLQEGLQCKNLDEMIKYRRRLMEDADFKTLS